MPPSCEIDVEGTLFARPGWVAVYKRPSAYAMPSSASPKALSDSIVVYALR